MDGNDWRAPQGQVQKPGQVNNGEVSSAPGMDVGDWRTQLQPDSRHRIVNEIHRMETLKRHLPFSGPEGLQELKKIALRFEEKIYSAATSQSDYLRKISLKMLTMETKSQNPMANPLQSNAPSNSMNPPDQASQAILSQMQNQVPQIPMPIASNQAQVRQQPLPQNMPPPSSTGLTPGMSQGVPIQNPNLHNLQNMPNVSQNAAGLGAPQQRQMQGRPQQIVAQEQQQQSQNSQQYPYNPQLQQHILKHKFQQGNVPQSMMQSQIQQQQQQQQPQQNLLPPNSQQPSQQGLMQPSLRQMPTPSTLQPNQQSSLQQQPNQSMLQQQSQSVRQQQGSMPQHPMMSLQQQQQLMGQQSNVGNMQQSQLIGQPNSMLDAQQQHHQPQRVIAQQNVSGVQQQPQTIHQQNALQNVHQQQSTVQQNNLSNVHQQQVATQTNLSSFQPQQIGGIQHGNATMQPNQQPVHTLQHSKVSVQQQTQQNMGNMLPNQSLQSQSQPMQLPMASQFQSQPGQMQQQLGLQQQGNMLQRDMQQRIQSSGGPLLQQQTAIDQQKQLLQTQRVVPDQSASQSTQTGNASGGDWQEEVYQKIKSMYELYYPELNEMYQRMAAKLQQHDALPQQPKNEQLEKLRIYKSMLERYMMFLRTNKNEVIPSHREKIGGVEKQIVSILNNNRPRKPPGHFGQPQMQAMPQSQQQQPQVSQNHNEGQMNSQMQQMNAHGSVMSAQQNNLTGLQQIPLSSGTGVLNSRQSMLDASQSVSSADPGPGHALNQIQQVAMSSLQQNPVSTPQQMNNNSIQSQSGISPLQSNAYPLQANSNVLQPQQIKQEQQMFSAQQVKQQYQQRQMQHQYLQRQQLLQQQATQQPASQLHPQQMMQQLNQTNDTNDIKMRHQMSGKPGLIQQHPSSGQRSSFHQQSMKSGSPYSVTSQPILQAVSPQIGHHPSPQIDQQYLLASHKAGTPLQSANSPFIAPSPSTSMAPSPAPVDSEKINPSMSSLLNAENVRNQTTVPATVPGQSLSIGTPGISASPLLAEFTSTDGTHGAQSTVVSGNSSVLEQPLQRLLKAVKSMPPRTLSASVNDISSVVSMVDRIAGSAPGNGSRAAVGEDLVAMTKCRIQARNFFTQDGPGGTKKMRRYTTAVPSNVVSSTGSVNDNARHLNGNESDGESTGASSSIKRPRVEANHALEEELREINQRLIDTVVYISEDDVDPTAAAEGGGGMIVKCSYSAVALSHNLKSQYASAQMSPIQPLRLLIPKNYPNCSPILLDNFPVEVSKEYEDLSIKAKARFNISLRALEQPMSLGEIAKTWDKCARAVISEYAQKSGGGTFSSKYGTWENCLSSAS